MKGDGLDEVGRLPIENGPKIRMKYEAQEVCCRGSGVAKGNGKYERSKCREVCLELGGPLSDHRNSRGWYILLGGYGREIASLTMERKQFEEVLSLVIVVINVLCCR